MNNQAAQTMHEPEDWQKIHVLMSVMEFRPLSDSERKEMHEALVSVRKSAALSQTAGVEDGLRGEVTGVAHGGFATISVDCSHIGPHYLSEGDTFTLINDKAAAPAASGGGCRHDWRGDGLCDRCGATYQPQPPACASVSEALATIDECADGTFLMTRDRCRRLSEARTVLEQALTQQRGIGVGVDVTGDGAHVTVRDGATIVYSEFHPLTTPKQCGSPEPVAWQYRCTDQRDGVSLWVDIDADYVDLVRGKDGIDVRALYTTPQPGAVALREGYIPNVIHDFKMLRFGIERVIHELRTYDPAADEYKGAHIHKVWADELESLLGRGGK